MKTIEERDPQTYAIIGAAMEIHRRLGHGFPEAVYQQAAIIEFPLRAIPFEREVALPIKYKNILLPIQYRADFVCFPLLSLSSKLYRNYQVWKKRNFSTISKPLECKEDC